VQEHKQQKPRLLGIIRAQFSHQRKYWITKHTRKARFRFKITFFIMMEDFKKDIKNSLKEMLENTSKQVEAFREETKNP